MYLVGLTGNIGMGKSTISNYLINKKNIPVIDSDQIARDVVVPNSKCWHLIRNHFGPDSINKETGQINRSYIAQIIFNDPEQRQILNRITHPEIQKRVLMKILYYLLTFHTFIFLDIPLLFEVSPYRRILSYIVVVKCDESKQFERIKLRNPDFDEEQIWSRIKAQMPIEEKCQHADFLIDNNGSIYETYQQIDNVLNKLHPPFSFYIIRLILIMIYALLIFLFIVIIGII